MHRTWLLFSKELRKGTPGYKPSVRTLDLRSQQAVADFFAQEKPDYVVLAAAK